jgi:exopolysaccharide biosynthesis polyprenyl glycosylphosphotransferase
MSQGETLGVSVDSLERREVSTAVATTSSMPMRFRRDWLRRRMLAIGDACSIALASLLLLIADQSGSLALKVLAFAPAWLLLAKVCGLYDRDHRTLRPLTVDEIPRVIVMTLVGSALLGVSLVALGLGGLTDGERIELWIAVAACVLATRAGVRALYRGVLPRERTLVIGQSSLARAIRRKLELLPDLNLEIVSELSDDEVDELDEDSPILAGIERIVVARPSVDEDLLVRLVRLGRAKQIKISLVPPMRPRLGTATQLTHVGDLAVVEYHTWDTSRTTILAKRVLDVTVSLTLLIVMSPVILVVALLVLVCDGRPVLFIQERAGIHGEPFRMLKFRTMVGEGGDSGFDNANGNGLRVPKSRHDPRVTRLGRVLRRTSLDELPQLLNVLSGRMSLVGPRPEQVEIATHYSSDQLFRLNVKPGLTGPMQVYGRGALDRGERLSLERDYIENMSLTRDIRILGLTIGTVLRGNGAF